MDEMSNCSTTVCFKTSNQTEKEITEKTRTTTNKKEEDVIRSPLGIEWNLCT